MSNNEEGNEETPPFVEVKLFGHDIYRIFRDDKKNILKIVLKNPEGKLLEFTR